MSEQTSIVLEEKFAPIWFISDTDLSQLWLNQTVDLTCIVLERDKVPWLAHGATYRSAGALFPAAWPPLRFSTGGMCEWSAGLVWGRAVLWNPANLNISFGEYGVLFWGHLQTMLWWKDGVKYKA